MATDKPRSHHKRPVAEKEAPEEVEQGSGPAEDDIPTREELAQQVQRLAERAKAGVLDPLANIGRAVVKGFLESLEDADSSKKKR